MLGDDLLVAPVLEPGVDDWEVYLPEGDWVDAFTGAVELGGRVIRRPVPIDELPVFIKARASRELRELFAP
jgi:alpha-glucosidase (family GH31 glycosyl hydrolase)